MSRVIKAAIWQTKPRIVDAPPPPPPRPKEEAVTLTEESRQSIMDTIREKEENADRLLREAKISSEIIRQEAKKKAEEILAEAEGKLAAIKESAKKEGYDAGFAAGREEGIEQVQQEERHIITNANARAENSLAAAEQEAEIYVHSAENEIADLALDIVGKILPQHFIDVPQVILPLVRKALLKIKDQTGVTVHVPPLQYDLVFMARAEFQSLLEGNAHLQVKSDESLSPGDCLIESPNGTVDAGAATQLGLLKKAVQDVMQ